MEWQCGEKLSGKDFGSWEIRKDDIGRECILLPLMGSKIKESLGPYPAKNCPLDSFI